jgi:hypothetical protein
MVENSAPRWCGPAALPRTLALRNVEAAARVDTERTMQGWPRRSNLICRQIQTAAASRVVAARGPAGSRKHVVALPASCRSRVRRVSRCQAAVRGSPPRPVLHCCDEDLQQDCSRAARAAVDERRTRAWMQRSAATRQEMIGAQRRMTSWPASETCEAASRWEGPRAARGAAGKTSSSLSGRAEKKWVGTPKEMCAQPKERRRSFLARRKCDE